MSYPSIYFLSAAINMAGLMYYKHDDPERWKEYEAYGHAYVIAMLVIVLIPVVNTVTAAMFIAEFIVNLAVDTWYSLPWNKNKD